MIKYYQIGGEQMPPSQMQAPQMQPPQAPQPPQGQGEDIMALFQAFFQMNGMDEQQQQQFIQEFQALPPQDQEQVLQHIAQQVQGGAEGQPPVEGQEQVPMEQEAPPEMQEAPMQLGGFNPMSNGMRFEMANNGILPVQFNGVNGANGNKQRHFQTGINYDPNFEEANTVPFVQDDSMGMLPMMSGVPTGVLPLPGASIPVAANQIPMRGAILPQVELPLGHSEVGLNKPVTVSAVNKAASKPVSKLTNKDREILSQGHEAIQKLQMYLDANGGKTLSKRKNGEYDGVVGDNTINAMKTVYKKETGKEATSPTELAKFFNEKVAGSGVKVTPTDIKANLTRPYLSDEDSKDVDKFFNNSNNTANTPVDNMSETTRTRPNFSTLTTPTGAVINSYNPGYWAKRKEAMKNVAVPGKQEEFVKPKSFDSTFGKKVSYEDKIDTDKYYADKAFIDNLNFNIKPNSINNWKPSHLSDKLQEVGNGIYFEPTSKKFVTRSPMGGYNPVSKKYLKELLQYDTFKKLIR